MTKRRFLALAMLVALVAAACGDDDAGTGGPITEIGDGEGAVSIIAWAGYIERGDTDPNFDWVTQFEADTGCIVSVKTAATSDEMVALMQGSRAMQGPDYSSEKNLAIWEKYTGVKPDVIRAGIPLVYSPDMLIAKENLVKQEAGHREAGFTDYQTAVPLEKMIDESFQQKALAQLGPFKR